MKPRFPLYAQLLLWLALNLILGATLFVALPGSVGPGWDLLLSQAVRGRLASIGDSVGTELSHTPQADWQPILQREDARYDARFTLTLLPKPPGGWRFGEHAFGEAPDPHPEPSAVAVKPDSPIQVPDPNPAKDLSPNEQDDPFFRRFRRGSERIGIMRTGDEYAVRIPLLLRTANAPPQPADLTVHLHSVWRLLRFLAVSDWVLFFSLLSVLSALLWWPFVWSMLRTLRQLTAATQTIAEGRFAVRVRSRRPDELGALAGSVNRMAERLDAQMAAQRQFMADVAHEVISPLARMQIGLGTLRHRLDGTPSADTVDDVLDDARQMATMLDELMLFSRTGFEAGRQAAEPVRLRERVGLAAQREGLALSLEAISEDMIVSAPPALLDRAIANLLRNALRHASGSISTVAATRHGPHIRLAISDRGPGVPEAALARLGEPFYRPDLARESSTGGFGLGLAIVRRCAEACGGGVRFANRVGGGFEAELLLNAA